MGLSDSFMKNHPIAAFMITIASDVIFGRGNQTEKATQQSTSYGYDDHPRQIQYASSPKNYNNKHKDSSRSNTWPTIVLPNQQYDYERGSSSTKKALSRKDRREDEQRVSRRIDYSKKTVEDWHKKQNSSSSGKNKDDYVLQRRSAYEEKGVLMRTYQDSKGEDVVEQQEYRVKTYAEHQLSPARTESRGSKHGSHGHKIVSLRDHRRRH